MREPWIFEVGLARRSLWLLGALCSCTDVAQPREIHPRQPLDHEGLSTHSLLTFSFSYRKNLPLEGGLLPRPYSATRSPFL